jgi:uncharacterized protein (DUF111 family)
VHRSELQREFIEVVTQWGPVPVKCGKLGEEIITFAPEHDACAEIARENHLTVKEVSEAARAAAQAHR